MGEERGREVILKGRKKWGGFEEGMGLRGKKGKGAKRYVSPAIFVNCGSFLCLNCAKTQHAFCGFCVSMFSNFEFLNLGFWLLDFGFSGFGFWVLGFGLYL